MLIAYEVRLQSQRCWSGVTAYRNVDGPERNEQLLIVHIHQPID